MSDQTWSQVSKLEDGQSLDAKTLNTPVGQLTERTDYLKRRLDILGSGDRAAVVLSGVSVQLGSGDGKGCVVYYDADNDKFLPAKASMSLYDDFTASNSALVVGVLVSDPAETGDVLVYGQLGLGPTFSVASIIESGEKFRPGRYYLSSKEAGRITANPSGPLIYIGSFGGSAGVAFSEGSTAIVNPQFLDIGTSHVHRVAALLARPAGTVSGGEVLGYPDNGSAPTAYLLFGGTWTNEDSATYTFSLSGGVLSWSGGSVSVGSGYVDVENGLKVKVVGSPSGSLSWDPLTFPYAARGWKDCEAAEGEEGYGAKYEYVIGMDPQVSNYWPPVPARSAALVVNGVEVDNGDLFPGSPTVKFGARTMYWYEDEPGKKPWPEGATTHDAVLDPSADKTMAMYWVRCFQSASGPVTSIQVKDGSPLKIYGYGTDKHANTGDLEIAADIDFEVVDGGAPGFIVPKSGKNGKLIGGPVVEKIVAGPGISMVSSAESPSGQGTVMISLGDATSQPFSDIALENADQAKLGMFPYVRLKGYPSGASSMVPSAFTATIRLPMSLNPDMEYAIKMQATVFGEASFADAASQSMAAIKLDYNILPDYLGEDRYSNLKNGLVAPDSSRNLSIPFGHQVGSSYKYDAYDPVVVTTEGYGYNAENDVVSEVLGPVVPYRLEFSDQTRFRNLKPGYLLGIRISRAISSAQNPYRGAVGFINLSWTLEAAE